MSHSQYWKMRKRLKHRAKERNIEITITSEDLRELRESVTHCPICSGEFIEEENHPAAPSVDRIDASKGYIKGNCVILCRQCNSTKSGFDMRGETAYDKRPSSRKEKIVNWVKARLERG